MERHGMLRRLAGGARNAARVVGGIPDGGNPDAEKA